MSNFGEPKTANDNSASYVYWLIRAGAEHMSDKPSWLPSRDLTVARYVEDELGLALRELPVVWRMGEGLTIERFVGVEGRGCGVAMTELTSSGSSIAPPSRLPTRQIPSAFFL
jgi:hypothetical protein